MNVSLKSLIICPFCIVALLFSLPAVQAKELANDVLVQERTAVCYVEGEVFDSLILGSKGSIQFVLLDNKLSKALSKAHSDIAEAKTSRYPFPEWMEDNNHFFAKEGKSGYVIFMAELKAFKPWNVSQSEIFVGDYHLTKNDILTPSIVNPFGEIASGTVWHFVFAVPKSEVRQGSEINIGYGRYSVKWKVPK